MEQENAHGIRPDQEIQVAFRVTKATGWQTEEAKRRLETALDKNNTRTIVAAGVTPFEGVTDSRWWFFYVAYQVHAERKDRALEILDEHLQEHYRGPKASFFFAQGLYNDFVVRVRVVGQDLESQRGHLRHALTQDAGLNVLSILGPQPKGWDPDNPPQGEAT